MGAVIRVDNTNLAGDDCLRPRERTGIEGQDGGLERPAVCSELFIKPGQGHEIPAYLDWGRMTIRDSHRDDSIAGICHRS